MSKTRTVRSGRSLADSPGKSEALIACQSGLHVNVTNSDGLP